MRRRTPSGGKQKKQKQITIIPFLYVSKPQLNALFLVRGEDLLATLASRHAVLLLLAQLGRRQLGLLLRRGDLVAEGIELLLLLLLALETGSGALALHPVVAGRRHLAVDDGPDLLGEILGELGRMGDDDDTALEGLQRLGESTKGVAVEVVGRLVKDDQMRTLPRAGGQDDLDTLSTGKTQHAGMGNELGIKTEVGAVLLDLLADQRTELSRGESLLLIDIGNHLLMGGENLGTWDPGVVGSHHRSPSLVLHADVLTESEGTLVLVGVLELAARVDTDNTTLSALDLVDLVHGLLVLIGDDLVGTIHSLTILTSLETPLDVLGWSLLQVVIDMRESVLLDVCDTDVLVGVDITNGWDELTGQDVDESRLASTVGANDGNTGTERALEGDVGDLWLGSTWVLEGHLVDTDDGLGLGLDTLKETWFWELELHLGGTELVVRLGGWALLDELLQVTTVTLELEALVVDDVLADVVQEGGVVGNDDGRARGVLEVLLEPLDVLHVQMVSRLIEKQNIWVLEHGTSQSQLHLPTTGKSGDQVAGHLCGETEIGEAALDLFLGSLHTNLGQLLHGPGNGGLLSIGRVKVVLNEHSLDLGLLWETLNLLVVDSAHEGGLSGTVRTAKTVTLSTLQAEMSLVKKNLGTISQVECAVAEVLALLVISLLGILGLGTWRGALAELINDLHGIITNKGDDVWLKGGGPAVAVGILLVDQLTGKSGNVSKSWLELSDDGLVLDSNDLLERGKDSADVTGVGDLWDLVVHDGTDTLEGVETLLGLLTSLWISQVLVVLLQSWHQLWQERSDDVWILDELAHVVDNDGRLTLDGGLTLTKTTLQERNHDGKGWLVDIGNESGGTEQVNGLWDVVWLGDTLDELRNETVDILVDDEPADLLHGTVGHLLDLWLGVPHRLGDNWDEVWHAESELCWGRLDESLDTGQTCDLLLPFLGSENGVDDGWEDGLDTVGVDALDDGQGGDLGGALHSGDLVTNRGEDVWEEDDEVWLNGGRDLGVLRDGLDGVQGTLTKGSILLVGKLLDENVDRPVEECCQR